MEVTRLNFQEVLVELDNILENATFLAIDTEFTGFNAELNKHPFDSPEQYYQKLKTGSMDFILIQFGLSVFTFDTETHKYSHRSYNFYVLPQSLNRIIPDCRFTCQASSMSFLASKGFDFNKLFNLGIPYLALSKKDQLVKQLEKRQKARDEMPEITDISDDDGPVIEDICTRIDEFIVSETEELTIENCNSFIRRLVFQELRARWPNKLKVEENWNGSKFSLVVRRSGTKEEEEQIEIRKRERVINETVGLSILLKKIVESKKLIVGHNMLLDLCYIIHQFFEPLPNTYEEFKSFVHSLFPRIVDTKVLSLLNKLNGCTWATSLNMLFEMINESPFEIPKIESIEGRSYSTLEKKYHEAGYDAYITGMCFIALSNYIGFLKKSEIPIVLPDSHLLEPFLNKLLIIRLRYIHYINLVGTDKIPKSNYMFHLTFPKDWKPIDISRLFSPFGGVYVTWLSDTSAYISLKNHDQADAVVKALSKGSPYRLQTYFEYQASLETNNSGEHERNLSSFKSNAMEKQRSPNATKNEVTTQKNEVTTQNNDGWTVATGSQRRKRKWKANAETWKKKKTFPETNLWE